MTDETTAPEADEAAAPAEVDDTTMSDQRRAAQKRKAAAEGDAPLDARAAQYVEALKIERAGYVMRGLDDRVAQVDDAIAHWSGVAKPSRRGRKS